jgi:putative transposase
LAEKKVWDQPLNKRQSWIEANDSIALSRQCQLLKVTRSVIYEQKKRLLQETDKDELVLLRLLDKEYTRHPFYGSRRMTKYLCGCGYVVNRKRVQRLMQTLGLVAMSPGPSTSKPHPQHKIYPYLLRGVDINRPNQVWSTDITYLRLPRGFVYLVAISDWHSRKVLSWRLSNTMDAGFCVDCLEEAITLYGTPAIFNSDQGSQFTSDAFTGVLQGNGLTISMDGRGRALDNIFVERLWRTVKYEEVYLKQHSNMPDLLMGLTQYFQFYNQARWHQALNYKTPDEVYQTARGGGAKIVDKFNGTTEVSELVPQNGDSAIQLECEQGSILN